GSPDGPHRRRRLPQSGSTPRLAPAHPSRAADRHPSDAGRRAGDDERGREPHPRGLPGIGDAAPGPEAYRDSGPGSAGPGSSGDERLIPLKKKTGEAMSLPPFPSLLPPGAGGRPRETRPHGARSPVRDRRSAHGNVSPRTGKRTSPLDR